MRKLDTVKRRRQKDDDDGDQKKEEGDQEEEEDIIIKESAAGMFDEKRIYPAGWGDHDDDSYFVPMLNNSHH